MTNILKWQGNIAPRDGVFYTVSLAHKDNTLTTFHNVVRYGKDLLGYEDTVEDAKRLCQDHADTLTTEEKG